VYGLGYVLPTHVGVFPARPRASYASTGPPHARGGVPCAGYTGCSTVAVLPTHVGDTHATLHDMYSTMALLLSLDRPGYDKLWTGTQTERQTSPPRR